MEAKEAKKNTQSKCSRNFLITLNEVDKYEKVHNYLLGLKSLNYYIATKEIAPTTNHPHIHIYCQFENSIRLSMSKLCGAHLDKCYGSPQQNLDYIHKVKEPEKKGEIFDEWGELKEKGGLRIRDIKNMDKDERDDLNANLYNIAKKITLEESVKLTLEDFTKKIKVYYIWGVPGIGKTDKAKELIKEEFKRTGEKYFNNVKFINEFWIGAGPDEKIALYDDFRDSHMKPSEFINFIDYNVHTMNVKNGFQRNNYNFIVITSVQDPTLLYENMSNRDEPMNQWMRRMEIIHLTKYGNVKRPPVKLGLDDL